MPSLLSTVTVHGKTTHGYKQTHTHRRLEGKQRSGIAAETRRKIAELILEAKRTLSIDISELELPYIPKQVLDCIFIDHLIADKNLLDEIDPAIGRMGNLSVLRCSSSFVAAIGV